MATVLIIDDDPDFRYALSRAVKKTGHNVVMGGTMAEGRQIAETEAVDAVFLDVRLPDGNGLELLPDLARTPAKPEVIIITGAGDSNGAELAMTNGAWDYINKNTSSRHIMLTLQRALQYRREREISRSKADKKMLVLRRDNIIGASEAIKHCFDQLAQCAATDVNVVLTGETGTGKELFAKAIHNNSNRVNGPFVIVDCAALPETLVESILFGHKKGSFTGADVKKEGLILQANKGTLFFDEIGELPLNIQKILLRVVQERKVRPVGSRHEVECDFRIVAATNRNLEEMVENHTFRKDLFFRIQSMSILLPPLRNRTADIRAIALYHINRLCKRMKVNVKGASDNFLESLRLYSWPGNVRELVNSLEQALVIAGDAPMLYSKHLPLKIRIVEKKARFSDEKLSSPSVLPEPLPDQADESLDGMPTLQAFRNAVYAQAEERYLKSLMELSKGNKKTAMAVSGLSQSRFYALLQKYNLPKDKKIL